MKVGQQVKTIKKCKELACVRSCVTKAKFHYTSWFGASSELASVMEFGF